MNQRQLTARIGRWTVRLVLKDGLYGYNYKSVHDKDDPLVEFYDATQSVVKFGPWGQFVTRYYASTLMEKPLTTLALDLGIPEWTVNEEEAKVVSAWLRLTVPAAE